MPDDQRRAILGVARQPRRQSALHLVLIDGGAERGDDVGGRRKAPLPRLLHVLPLIAQIHGERAAVAAGALKRRAPGDDEAHARHALEAFSGGRNQRIEAHRSGVDGNCRIGTHRVDDEPRP
jgi:hypothetical protein